MSKQKLEPKQNTWGISGISSIIESLKTEQPSKRTDIDNIDNKNANGLHLGLIWNEKWLTIEFHYWTGGSIDSQPPSAATTWHRHAKDALCATSAMQVLL